MPMRISKPAKLRPPPGTILNPPSGPIFTELEKLAKEWWPRVAKELGPRSAKEVAFPSAEKTETTFVELVKGKYIAVFTLHRPAWTLLLDADDQDYAQYQMSLAPPVKIRQPYTIWAHDTFVQSHYAMFIVETLLTPGLQ